MRFALILLFYAFVGSFALVIALDVNAINPVIAFLLFISYAVLGGLLFRQLNKRIMI